MKTQQIDRSSNTLPDCPHVLTLDIMSSLWEVMDSQVVTSTPRFVLDDPRFRPFSALLYRVVQLTPRFYAGVLHLWNPKTGKNLIVIVTTVLTSADSTLDCVGSIDGLGFTQEIGAYPTHIKEQLGEAIGKVLNAPTICLS